MEVASPVHPNDFDFTASAYASAPSTPRFMGDYHFSAPTSPTRIPDLYSQFEELLISESDDTHRTNYCLAAVPFAWEEKPGVPKSVSNVYDRDFAFDVSSELHRDSSVSAEDIFHGGVIKQHEQPPITPPSSAANKVRERGRERTPNSGLSSSRSRRTRSLPPFRGSELKSAATTTTAASQEASSSTTLSVFGSKKWSFKDLFLFRSASDGRAMAKDPFKKYSSIFRKHDEDLRNSSLRHRSGSGSGSGSSKRRSVPRVSAHELHYTVNRAVSIDMKKQTFLPYKQGILGRLAFNPTVHALSNGFGRSHNYLEMD
ncbi:uncharacterized protein LOC143580486 [Bidens hawaiensis]|uniref:uncharacterized protein LOC143580486 n=1 Tax=Bidens hawaiensis TaxID=980011 RepID=UPI00404A4B06